jgi:hypothetical protein
MSIPERGQGQRSVRRSSPASGNVADLDQWARWFAVMTLLEDGETNISNGQDDDYVVYLAPDAAGHRRVILLPHDFDTILGRGDNNAISVAKRARDCTTRRRRLYFQATPPAPWQ